MSHNISLKPVAWVASPVEATVDANWGGIISRINLMPEYAGALEGLESFSHAIIVTWLHRAEYLHSRHLQRRPRGLEEMPLVGIFSQRAKDRPNPIGLTAVQIVRVGREYLEVRGLDAVDRTPVLDIKPYYPHYDRIDSPRIPEWVDRLMSDYF